MNKQTEKRLKELILFLKEINESELEMNLDLILNLVEIKDNKSILRKAQYHSSMCKMYAIHVHGIIKEEYQEQLNENGFAIEKNINNVEGNDLFYIRTEKGLLTF